MKRLELWLLVACWAAVLGYVLLCPSACDGADVLTKCKAATVRIYTQDCDGTTSLGSGVIVRHRGRPVVLTAAHVVRNAKRVWIWTRGRWVQTRTLKIDVRWDQAALDAIGCMPEDAVDLHAGPPARGTRVRVCGYAGMGTFACRPGEVTRYTHPMGETRSADWMDVSTPARPGDSGGPILTESGELAGVLWGSNAAGTAATQPGRLAMFMADLPMEQKSSVSVELASLPMFRGGQQPQQPPPTSQPTRRLVPICRPKPVPPPVPMPAPQIVVQSDPRVIEALAVIQANTTPRLEPTKPPEPEGASPMALAVAAIGACVLGFVVYFAALNK